MKHVTVALLAFALIACGASQSGSTSEPATSEPATSEPATSEPGTSDSASSDACEGYSAGDPCIDETNLAQCREMAAQCPGQVAVMESCPLQFACP